MIRAACIDDITQMANLLGELFAIEDDFTIDAEKQYAGLELLVKSPEATVLVALEAGRIVGMASMQRIVSTAMGGYVGLIEDVIVTKEYRHRGIGSRLIEGLIAESQKQGFLRLALGADQRNDAALSFYRTYGFDISQMRLLYRF